MSKSSAQQLCSWHLPGAAHMQATRFAKNRPLALTGRRRPPEAQRLRCSGSSSSTCGKRWTAKDHQKMKIAEDPVAVSRVARAASDGYTTALGDTGDTFLNGAIYSLPYGIND